MLVDDLLISPSHWREIDGVTEWTEAMFTPMGARQRDKRIWRNWGADYIMDNIRDDFPLIKVKFHKKAKTWEMKFGIVGYPLS